MWIKSTEKTDKQYAVKSMTFLALSLILTFGLMTGCEGPAGPEGPQGPQGPEGPQGPVGPAGEDGSTIHSGTGTPASDIGENGDYYLNTNTGELYGPKDSGGWGSPIIVLKGEDGQDGQDGSQIFSGTGAPSSSLGVEGDYYLDKSSYELYGPKTSSGWGTPLNLKGADGNANVTRYIFPGHDFGSDPSLTPNIWGISNTEFKNSAWQIYLANDRGLNKSTFRYYPIPGDGISSTYSISFGNINDSHTAFFIESSGGGAEYERIEIIRIKANNTEDQRKQIGDGAIIPEDLDVSDYEAVAEYYDFYK